MTDADSKAKAWFHAIQSGNLVEVERLLPECTGLCGEFGETGLQCAAQTKNIEIAKLLVEYEVGMVNNEGCTALVIAALSNAADLCALLAPLEADIPLPDGRNAHMLAAQVGSLDALVVLQPHFALTTDSHDLNALDYAAMTGNARCVAAIVEHFNPSTQERAYSCMLAENENNAAVVQYLDTGILDPEQEAGTGGRCTESQGEPKGNCILGSIVPPAQGAQSPRMATTQSLNYNNAVIEEDKDVSSSPRWQYNEIINPVAVPAETVERSPMKKKPPKDKARAKSEKVGKRQKNKEEPQPIQARELDKRDSLDQNDLALALIEKQYQDSQETFSTIRTNDSAKHTTSQDSVLYPSRKSEQRAKSGFCGSKVIKKKGFTQSSNDFIPLLRQKDSEILYLQSQLEALASRRSTLLSDSFATADACTSTNLAEPAAAATTAIYNYDELLRVKDEQLERIIALCTELQASQPQQLQNSVQWITTCSLPQLDTTTADSVHHMPDVSKGVEVTLCADNNDRNYSALLLCKDEEVSRLQELIHVLSSLSQTQQKQIAQLHRDLEIKILKETELIVVIDEIAQEIKRMKECIVTHKKVVSEIQQQGFVTIRKIERDISLEDLLDNNVKLYNTAQEAKQQLIACKAELAGYIGQAELLARSFYTEVNARDVNKSLKRSNSYSNVTSVSMTTKLPVPNPNPPTVTTVTLHHPARSSTIGLQPLKPQKLNDYTGLLRSKDTHIERLVELLYTSPTTLYAPGPQTSRSSKLEEEDNEQKSFHSTEHYKDVIVQQNQIINDLRKELEEKLRPPAVGSMTLAKTNVKMADTAPDMLLEDLQITKQEAGKDAPAQEMDALAKLELEHAAMQREIDTMTREIARKDNAIIFFADHYTKKAKKSLANGNGAKVITALELEVEALKSQLQVTTQEVAFLKNELKQAVTARLPPVKPGMSSHTVSNNVQEEITQILDLNYPVIIPPMPIQKSSLTKHRETESRPSSPLRSTSLLRQTISRAKSRTAAQNARLMNECKECVGYTKLMQAVIDGDARQIGMYLDLLCLVTEDGKSALMLAAIHDRVFAVEYLINGEVGLVDKAGKTALIYALELGHLRIAELLAPYECPDVSSVDITRTGVRTTELMMAVANNDLPRAWALLPMQHGVKDKSGKTALVLAIEHRRPALMRILLPLEHMYPLPDGTLPIDFLMSLDTTKKDVVEMRKIAAEYFNFQ